jgi:hypothetical protein
MLGRNHLFVKIKLICSQAIAFFIVSLKCNNSRLKKTFQYSNETGEQTKKYNKSRITA